jgi:hypothetical protein
MDSATSKRCGPVVRRKPRGGYVLVSVIGLVTTWWAFRAKLIRLFDLRVWFAAQLAVAARCRLGEGQTPSYSVAELARRTGAGEKRVRSSLRRLEAAGLLRWSASEIAFSKSPDALPLADLSGLWAMLERIPNRKRLVPVPRSILGFLAADGSSSLIATVFAHLLRCLYYWPDEGCRSHGTCKASWIAEVFGISLRAAKAARKELERLGWLIRLDSPQWRMNRLGADVSIDLDWARPAPAGQGRGNEVAPPPAVSGPEIAPPESDKEPLRGYKNQEPASRPEASDGQTGFLISKGNAPERPTLRDVAVEDLRETGRLLELHGEAVREGLIGESESDRLRFVAAAEHARSIGKRNPCGLFVHLVRGKLWHYLTQHDEDAASRRLKLHLFGTSREVAKPVPPVSREPVLSGDARLVQAVQAAAARAGYRGDAFYLLRREKPEWTRDRWDAAIAESGRARTPSACESRFSVGGILGSLLPVDSHRVATNGTPKCRSSEMQN